MDLRIVTTFTQNEPTHLLGVCCAPNMFYLPHSFWRECFVDTENNRVPEGRSLISLIAWFIYKKKKIMISDLKYLQLFFNDQKIHKQCITFLRSRSVESCVPVSSDPPGYGWFCNAQVSHNLTTYSSNKKSNDSSSQTVTRLHYGVSFCTFFKISKEAVLFESNIPQNTNAQF